MLDLLLNVANVLVFLGTLLLMKEVIKNRNVLKDYSILGSFLTFISISLFTIGFYMMDIWTWTLETVTAFYWFLAFFFGLKNKVYSWWQQRKGRNHVFKLLGIKNKKEYEKLVATSKEYEDCQACKILKETGFPENLLKALHREKVHPRNNG